MSTSPPEIEARHLSLPKPIHTVSPHIDSLLYDAVSRSLALRHSDSSFSLYPSFPPLPLSALPPPQSLVPYPTSSAAFLHLRTAADPATTALFLVSSPVLRPSATLIRFYILREDRFVKIRVVSSHRDLEFDEAKFSVLFRVNHGVSMRLSGGINVFSLYSVSNSKIWVFAVRMIGDEGGGEALKLMKCATIDCCLPVYTIRDLFGFLILGEENGVRIFPLQPVIKGNHRKEKKNSGRRSNLKNGVDVAKDGNGGETVGTDGDSSLLSAKKTEKHAASVKLRSVKLRQDAKDVGAFFVTFEDKDVESSISTKMTQRSVKAISVQSLSANCFVVFDSVGDVHLLSLSYSIQGLDNSCYMKRLTLTMKVLKLAVFEDVSAVTRTIWVSDGCHSVHSMMVSGMDNSFDKTEKKETKGKLLQASVTQAIFASEKIKEIVPLTANAILILGQGNMFTYAISSCTKSLLEKGPVFAIIGAWLIYQVLNKDVIARDASERLFQNAIITTALSFVLSNFGPIDDWAHFAAAFTGIAYRFVTCPSLQVKDASSEERMLLVRRVADPCKSLLYFSLFLLLLSSLLFVIEPPLDLM